jgi:hypothetical protein
MSHVPVAFAARGIAGALRRMDDTTRANSSRTGSSSPEWKGWRTASGSTSPPSAFARSVKRATDSAVPDTTHERGAFTAASHSDSPAARRSSTMARVSASDIDTAAMLPGMPSSSAARRTTSVSASSTVKTPATHAATYSPSEWPATARGSIPRCFHSSASA